MQATAGLLCAIIVTCTRACQAYPCLRKSIPSRTSPSRPKLAAWSVMSTKQALLSRSGQPERRGSAWPAAMSRMCMRSFHSTRFRADSRRLGLSSSLTSAEIIARQSWRVWTLRMMSVQRYRPPCHGQTLLSSATAWSLSESTQEHSGQAVVCTATCHRAASDQQCTLMIQHCHECCIKRACR